MNNKLNIAFRTFICNLQEVSKCQDKGVSCIICSNNLHQIYSIGINGGPKGLKQECLCTYGDKYSCIHAEANALIKLTTLAHDKIMICSTAPCTQCASMIINESGGFAEVWYLTNYKSNAGLALLQKAGIKTGIIRANGEIFYDDSIEYFI